MVGEPGLRVFGHVRAIVAGVSSPRRPVREALLPLAFLACTIAAARLPADLFRNQPGASGLEGAPEHARELEAAGRFEEALRIVSKLNEAYPTNPVHLERLATLQHRLGHPADEAKALEEFVKLSPTPWEACPRLPRAYQDLGKPDAALDAHQRCAALEPENPELAFYYAHALLMAARPKEALAAIEPFIASEKPQPDVLLAAGMALRDTGDLSRAKDALERGLRAAPAYPDLHLILATVQVREGKREDAMRSLRRAVELAPENTEARKLLSDLGGGAK